MLISALKNYFKYFKQFFRILGIIFLSIFIFYLVFELTVYFPIKNGDVDNYNNFIDQMYLIIDNITIDQIFTSNFLSTTVKQLFSIYNETSPNVTLGTFLIVLCVGIVIGAFYYSKSKCKQRIRQDLQNKDTAKTLSRNILSSCMNIIFWLLLFTITYFWFYAIFILPFIALLFEALKTLIYTWYVFFKKYKMSQIITPLNCLKLICINFLILYVHIQIFIWISSYVSIYILLLLALSSYAYITSVTQFTATNYFVEKRAHRELKIAK